MTSPHASTLRRIAALPIVWAAVWHGPAPAQARTLRVGPGAQFAKPSEAAAAAQPGDRIEIAAGTWYDCAVWTARDLVIAGAGAGATRLTDKTCQGKAIMVIGGSDTTVADLTLARARVPDGNGAAIRAEAPDLTLLRLQIENNQDGVLAADQPDGTLRVDDCEFSGNGVAGSAHPTAALAVGHWRRLAVERSRFGPGPGESAIMSQATVTDVVASHLDRAGPGGATVAARGLILQDSTIEAGDGPGTHRAAVLALPGGAGPVLHGDRLQGGGTLLLNWSGREADLAGNTVDGGTEVSTAGSWRFWLSTRLHAGYAALRHVAGALRWRVLGLLR